MTTTAQAEVIQYGIDQLDDLKGQNVEASELHHALYNTDYFIIGTYQAKQWLDKYGAFDAIGRVQEYEQSNFGEVSTDLSNPERVANMLAYIIGEEALNNCDTLNREWDNPLSDDDLDAIKRELEAQL